VPPPDSSQGASALLQPGDLLLVITGATVGRCAVFPIDGEPGYVSQHVALCRLPADEIVPHYALWGLRSPDGQRQLLGQRYGQGKPGLNLEHIRSLTLPIPPLVQQRGVVTYLDRIQTGADALGQLQQRSGAQMAALMRAVLDRHIAQNAQRRPNGRPLLTAYSAFAP